MPQFEGKASKLGVLCLAAATFASGCWSARSNPDGGAENRPHASSPLDPNHKVAAEAGPAFHPRELRPEQRVHVIPPGPDAQATLQERFVDAAPGDVIQLGEGVYHLTHQLDLASDCITIRGQGSGKTVLSFKGQSGGSHGIEAIGDNLVFEGFAVEDTTGDGIKVLGSRNVVFSDVRAEWTSGPSSDNGAYGLYPVQCENVLMEHCTAIGSADAGLYVGQCRNVIVRNCLVERNVAGIEIENTFSADVHDNIARNNTAGILVFDLPGLPVKNGSGVRVFRNQTTANNHVNFADPGSLVATVPVGTGVMIIATDEVEIFDNDILGNNSASVLVLSYFATEKEYDDAGYDPIPENVSIHNNRIVNGGTNPTGEMATQLVPLIGKHFPDIMWDGVMPKGTTSPQMSLAENGGATFANFRFDEITKMYRISLLIGRGNPYRDPTALGAKIEALPEVQLPAHELPSQELPAAVRYYRSLPKALSEVGLFKGAPAQQEPAEGVVSYKLATELFSDYAHKRRFIKLPEGEKITYRESGVLEFPIGTVIAKTFSFPGVNGSEKLVETRIEARLAEGWFGASYLWNEEQDDALLCLGGRQLDLVHQDDKGAITTHRYEVPSANQCISCHGQVRGGERPAQDPSELDRYIYAEWEARRGHRQYEPLGPTAANMNISEGQQLENQLALLEKAGLLAGLPEANKVPKLPGAFDPHSGSIDERARAYLQVNCAHCHNPDGSARTSGLDLRLEQKDLARAGVLKIPVAAGRGAGGRSYDIVPGKPDESILVHRLETDEPAEKMPSLGRQLIHQEAVDLIREWIESLPEKR